MSRVLCLNSGSSSLKFSVYAFQDEEGRLELEGAAENVGAADGRLWWRDASGDRAADQAQAFPDQRAAVEALLAGLAERGDPPADAVGHRIVHGGAHHDAPECVTPELLEELRTLVPFAPLHLPSEIAAIEAVSEAFPGRVQVACFDTAFHRRMPECAERLPLPRALFDAGVRRYGFHGLSYESIVDRLDPAPDTRSVICHLGSGASMAAVRGRLPVDTTMGMTPTGGFMMGTRSGDLDPGVVLHLITEHGLGADDLERLLNRESGLRGVSGTTADMRELLERRGEDPAADLAVRMFAYQVRKQVGALAAALGGLDVLVFTGGIGERAAPVRREVCEGLAHLGIRLDEARNEGQEDRISSDDSPCAVRRIETSEELVIARHTRALATPSAP